ncbi:MAG: ChbG/HpnK family deacetylase, partial [Chloroflexota bacterium]
WLIPRLPPGVTEVMVHPGADNSELRCFSGWDYHWEEELRALLDPEVKALLEAQSVQRIHFSP